MFQTRVDNERYEIKDDETSLEGLVFSITVLKPNKETVGNKSDVDEIYIFKGNGSFKIGDEMRSTVDQDFFLIPKNTFRKIYNPNSEPLIIYNIWKNSEKFDFKIVNSIKQALSFVFKSSRLG